MSSKQVATECAAQGRELGRAWKGISIWVVVKVKSDSELAQEECKESTAGQELSPEERQRLRSFKII